MGWFYQIDRKASEVFSLVWDGPGAPKYPRFPISKGLTSVALKELKVVNVGDVASDLRYFTAFGLTRSEIIVPVFDEDRDQVVGTIDVESERPNADKRHQPNGQNNLETIKSNLRLV